MTPDAEDIVGKARALVQAYEKYGSDGSKEAATEYAIAAALLRAVEALERISGATSYAATTALARECLASLGVANGTK